MKLTGKSKHKLASRLVVELRSWFSKEDLDMVIKIIEAISSTKFKKLLRTYNFALFLVSQYETFFKTEQSLLEYVKIDLTDLLLSIKRNLVLNKMLNDK